MAKHKGPQFIKYFGPIIDALKDLGGSGRPAEVTDWIAENTEVPEEDINFIHKSGQSRFANQVAWGRFYLSRAKYLDSSVRGVWTLTEKGLKANITPQLAHTIFKDVQKEVREDSSDTEVDTAVIDVSDETIDEQGPEAANHQEKLMEVIKSLSPSGFERLCQFLLRESGFESVTVTGKSGDGGIDGIGVLQVTPFVSFKVLFQCKKYDGSVGSPHVRDFRGAMQGRADKGLIITTGTFTVDAKQEASRDGVPPIELVNGAALLDLFQNLEVGLKKRTIYEVDKDFFDEFR